MPKTENLDPGWYDPSEVGEQLLSTLLQAPVTYCPKHHTYTTVTSQGSGPGFTGCRIYWWTLACSCTGSDLTADSLEAVR